VHTISSTYKSTQPPITALSSHQTSSNPLQYPLSFQEIYHRTLLLHSNFSNFHDTSQIADSDNAVHSLRQRKMRPRMQKASRSAGTGCRRETKQMFGRWKSVVRPGGCGGWARRRNRRLWGATWKIGTCWGGARGGLGRAGRRWRYDSTINVSVSAPLQCQHQHRYCLFLVQCLTHLQQFETLVCSG
jgi:hypothetical protein